MYSTARWPQLAELFVKTHHEIFSLPPRPLLHIALSAGLSALKTPACHSHYASSSSNASSSTTSVCPICSTELNALARSVPYAHHSKSYVEDDPVMLPNGRIYGRGRLISGIQRKRYQEGLYFLIHHQHPRAFLIILLGLASKGDFLDISDWLVAYWDMASFSLWLMNE